MTYEEATKLQNGAVIFDKHGRKWRLNGKVRTYKRDKTRIEIPLKHGLYRYATATTIDLPDLRLA